MFEWKRAQKWNPNNTFKLHLWTALTSQIFFTIPSRMLVLFRLQKGIKRKCSYMNDVKIKDLGQR